jgi:hypothetical protein
LQRQHWRRTLRRLRRHLLLRQPNLSPSPPRHLHLRLLLQRLRSLSLRPRLFPRNPRLLQLQPPPPSSPLLLLLPRPLRTA